MADTHFIDGHWQSSQGATFESRNPVDNDLVWTGQEAALDTVDQAVQAANQAFRSWKRTPLADRLAVLERFRALLGEHSEALATLIARETGKPIWESRTEIGAMQGKIELSVKAYHERTGEHATLLEGGQRILRHRPHGVMAVFGPYNFPGHLPNGHIVPALIAGNTVVFKPSEQTPATAEMTVRLWQEAGLPPGVINLVQGARATGEALSTHPAVNGILFTGSPQTGIAIQAAIRSQPQKILALEMGGNNPLIIGSDVDSEAAIWATLQSAFVSAGQRCTCARRLLVPSGAAGDEWLDQLVAAAGRLQVGAWDSDPQPFMGSVINAATAQRLQQAQQGWLDQGGKALLKLQAGAAPTLLSPGIVDLSGIEVADEEFFGPLLSVRRYTRFEEAIELANQTRFGLSAGLLSNNADEYEAFITDIRAGIVNWNQPITGASSAMPFGGTGLSGNYRPSAWYAADYCAYPVASLEQTQLQRPAQLPPGMTL
ncbi:succinylglutamate-semialdehyde dehydrogenase [Natronospirillum operosum]|uniref:N-succinylglutamate 5-semialdehyde dehydrogenase n=1 Tax=Natronospirillum operosum TaxID=2759953 RepID=A0A4Z0WCG0_9GAMM|nr:succinylglutamate-semialdehyde dehydrogenase [Natronospirillum operosum]TGG92555.1 succinylglutamate-semialdehyde dehydrogenase [Natronospirillum operosum]